MMQFTRFAAVAFTAFLLLPAVMAEPSDDAPPAGERKTTELPPPRFTFKCAKYYNSTTGLPDNNAMMSFMDKEGSLYIALSSETSAGGNKAGGLFVITAKGGSFIYNTKSNPPIPSDSVEHAWKDEELIYVSTGTAGLAVIDTKGTADNQADDTVRVYSMMGVTDVTAGLDAQPSSHSPSIGCDNVVFSWMDQETRDLLICAGGEDTYKGGLTVLLYDKEKCDYTKSYTYRAMNYRVDRSEKTLYEPGVFDTTQCYDPEREFLPLRGGDVVKRFASFGKNHFCCRAFRDNAAGRIYVARRDTLTADMDAMPNSDGGLTIIDTKKTADPSDDEVTVLDTGSTPALAGSDVYDVLPDPETGSILICTGDILGVIRDKMYGLVVIDKDGGAVTYRNTGLYDTTKDRKGELIDEKRALSSGFALCAVKNEKTGDLFVLQKDGIDIIHKDGFVSRVPCGIFRNLPTKPAEDLLWARHGWLDDKGLLYVCTGKVGGLGLLVLEMVEYKE